MPKRTSSYRESLLEDLRDPLEAANYLNAAIEDSPDTLLIALRNVAEAHSMSKVAKGAGVAREAVYRMLSAKGNPRWRGLRGVFRSLGLDFQIRPLEPERHVGIPKSSLHTSKGEREAPKGLKAHTVKQLSLTFGGDTVQLVFVRPTSVFPDSVFNVGSVPKAMNILEHVIHTTHDEILRTPAYMIPKNENEVIYAQTY